SDDRHNDSPQCSKEHHTSKGNQGPYELCPTDPKNLTEFPRLDQAHRIDNDDCCERGLRHQGDHGGEQEHCDKCYSGSHKLRDLSARSRESIHRSLSGPTSPWHRSEQCTSDICNSGCEQLLVRLRPWFVIFGKGASRSNSLGETHQSDA